MFFVVETAVLCALCLTFMLLSAIFLKFLDTNLAFSFVQVYTISDHLRIIIMNATVLDLRKNMKKIMSAIEHNEPVTLSYRGRKTAMIVPCAAEHSNSSAANHPAFGMWADRRDLDNVDEFVRNLRKGRF